MSLRKRPPPVDSGAPPSAIGIASNSWSRAPSAWRTSPSMELSAGLSCAQRDSAAHLNASGDGRRYCKGAADGPREHPRASVSSIDWHFRHLSIRPQRDRRACSRG